MWKNFSAPIVSTENFSAADISRTSQQPGRTLVRVPTWSCPPSKRHEPQAAVTSGKRLSPLDLGDELNLDQLGRQSQTRSDKDRTGHVGLL